MNLKASTEPISMNTKINSIEHIQTAHCENGVVTALLKNKGMDFMNEPLAFGIGAGLFYVHIPFLKLSGGPAVAFRTMPGLVFKQTAKSFGVKIHRRKFKKPQEAQDFLDQRIQEGTPVGCQVGVFNLPYFPKEYRFHFNAHNIIVSGYENGRYIVSDPVMEVTTTLSPEELEDVRYARGPLAPNGHIYYPTDVPTVSDEQINTAIKKGIKKTIWWMTEIPAPQTGATGFLYTAKQVRKWRSKLGDRKAGLYLGQIVRMQEEIGTGGGGFRFLYAAFLEQAAERLGNDKLVQFSEKMTKSGDLLRQNAVNMAYVYKGRRTDQSAFEEIADIMVEVSHIEKQAFKELKKLKL